MDKTVARADEPATSDETASPEPATSDEPVSPQSSPNKKLPREAEDYLRFKTTEQGRAKATTDSYRLDLNAYCAFLAEQQLDLQSVPQKTIINYVRAQQDLGLAQASIARSFSAIRGLHHYLVVEELRLDNPTDEIETPAAPQGLPKLLSVAEVKHLLLSVKGKTPTDRRDRAMLEMLYGAGLRVSELVKLNLENIDLAERVVLVKGKGSKERVVPLGSKVRTALKVWLASSGRGAMEPEQWEDDNAKALFLGRFGKRMSRQAAWQMVKKRGAAVGLGARLSPHTLRHCFATHMMDNGADMRSLQELLGHASVGTTQIYTHVSRFRIRSVYDESHPRALG